MSVKKKFKGLSDKAVGWLFIGPTVLLLLAINIYPLVYAIKMSFTNFYANKIGREPQFVGLKNYIKVLNKEAIWEKMQVTASFMFWTLLLQAIIGLGLALLLNRKFKGNELLTTLIVFFTEQSFNDSSCSQIPALIKAFTNFIEDPSRIGISSLSISTKALEIPRPEKAANKCSTVFTEIPS